MKDVQIADLAYVRSGDKGDVCNIGLLAKDAASYAALLENLTPEAIKSFFGPMVTGDVRIYPMPNIDALNIVMDGALGGGATRTLRWDQTGKSMGNVLSRLVITIE